MTERRKTHTNPLKIISNAVNAKIMILLKRHPMSPRDLARHIGKDEADIVRRLRNMQRSGLVDSAWGTRLGKNVKLYSLAASGFEVDIMNEGIRIHFDRDGNEMKKPPLFISESLEEVVEPADGASIIGRRQELDVLHSRELDFIFVVGVAGIGKTSLAKKFASEYSSTINNNQYNACFVFWHTFKEIDTLPFLLGKLAVFLSNRGIKDLIQHLGQFVGMETFATNTRTVTFNALGKLPGCVLILDDYHKVKDEKISFLIKGLMEHAVKSNTTERIKVIVLSRYEAPFYLNYPNCKELTLSGLSLEDASGIILSLDPKTLELAWKRYAGHPMALKIFSLFKKQMESKVDSNRIDSLHAAGSLAQLLSYFQREIFSILDEDELTLLTRLSVFRTPVSAKAFQDMHSIRHRRNMNYLLRSMQKKMLISISPSRQEISLHDTLKDAIYATLLYPSDIHALAAKYYLQEGHIESIVESMYHLIKCGRINEIMSMLEDEIIHEKYGFVEHGYAGPLLSILTAIDLTDVSDKLDAKQLVFLRSIQAKALAMVQNWEESQRKLQDAISIAEVLGDRSVMAYALKNYGEASYLQNKLDIVEAKFLAAARIFERLRKKERDNRPLKSVYLKLARLYFIKGKHEKSRIYSQKARKASEHYS